MYEYYLTYDIRQGNQYAKLYAALATLKARKITDSFYFFTSPTALVGIQQYLSKAIERDDSVYLVYWNAQGVRYSKVF